MSLSVLGDLEQSGPGEAEGNVVFVVFGVLTLAVAVLYSLASRSRRRDDAEEAEELAAHSSPEPPDTSLEEFLGKSPGSQAKWDEVSALGQRGDPQATDLLLELLRSEDWCTRRAAVEAAQNNDSHRALLPEIRGLLRDPSSYVVYASCRTLAKFGDRESNGELQAQLDAPDPELRRVALIALADNWSPENFEAVLEVHRNDSDSEVSKEAAWTLRKTANQESWRVLFDLWSTAPADRYRLWACELAAQFGDGSSLPVLQELSDDKNGHVRKAARRTLTQLKNRD